MNKVKVSFDNQKFQLKPSGDEVRYINNRIARSVLELTPEKMKKLAFSIGKEGCTFSPATFKNGRRNKDNFEQQQLIALDFDNKDPNKKISFEQVKERADHYDLPMFFAYDTLSSSNHNKFRVVFLNDVSITHRETAEAVQMAIGAMFPEADSSCYKDVSKLYFGGKEVIYYDEKISKINIEAVFRNYTCCMKEKYKSNHYKDHIARFAKETGIALNAKGLLDVKVSDHLPGTDDPTEGDGAKDYFINGKNSPGTIICNDIKYDGEIFPDRYYMINFGNNCTKEPSVKIGDEQNKTKNHKRDRSPILKNICKKCRLFDEFEKGIRKLSHEELFGIATNLVNIEKGTKYFLDIQLKYEDLYTHEKNERWKNHLSYMAQNSYKSENCDKYCPYREQCIHGRTIIATVHPERGSMEPIAGYHEEFCSMEEMQDDVYGAIRRALFSYDKKFYVIKAQVGAGKSHSYLNLMKENDEMRFLIAAPTNLLKNELYEKAKKMGIEVMVTPSLEEIKDDIPDSIWDHIQKLYKRGQPRSVHTYIRKKIGRG